MCAVEHQSAPAPHDRVRSGRAITSINTREVAVARRAVAQEAIRLANSGQIVSRKWQQKAASPQPHRTFPLITPAA